MTNLFLDSEFTSIEAPHLISLALVSEDGEYVYVEIEGWQMYATPSDFVRRVVLPLLSGPRMTPTQAMSAVASFLDRYERPNIWTDAPLYDGPLLAGLLGPDAPTYTLRTLGANCVKPGVFDVLAVDVYRDALDKEFAKGELRRHHALDDAKAAAAAWQVVRHTIARRRL